MANLSSFTRDFERNCQARSFLRFHERTRALQRRLYLALAVTMTLLQFRQCQPKIPVMPKKQVQGVPWLAWGIIESAQKFLWAQNLHGRLVKYHARPSPCIEKISACRYELSSEHFSKIRRSPSQKQWQNSSRQSLLSQMRRR